MFIEIQGSRNARSVRFFIDGAPIASQLSEIPEDVELAIQTIEEHCLTQQTPEQKMIQEANDKVSNIINAFDQWLPNGVNYTAGNVVSFNGSLYKVIQDHKSQLDWQPDVAVSLFLDITVKQVGEETGVPGMWIQPTGAHDAYNLGDKVTHNGKVWENITSGNIWEPGVYGWAEVN